jgi:L-lactate dehydrogenase
MVEERKIAIIGVGDVGATFAYTLMRSGLAGEIVLVDKNRQRAEGEALDLNHGLFFAPPVEIRAGDIEDCEGAAITVVTAGAAQKEGESRLDLLKKNAAICKSIMEDIVRVAPETIVLMVTNPVDVLTYLAIRYSGLPAKQVIGSGTVLDSSRFRYMLSDVCGVDPRNVHAYVLGEHGDSEVAAWSLVHLSGVPLNDFCRECAVECGEQIRKEITDQVRDSAYHIIEYKGATYYAVSLALERIVGSILRGENSILTVSTLVDGPYGIKDVCLSLPTMLNREGAGRVIEVPLTEDELRQLRKSAEVLREATAIVGE